MVIYLNIFLIFVKYGEKAIENIHESYSSLYLETLENCSVKFLTNVNI